MATVRPLLMFDGRALEALALYAAIIPGAEIATLTRYGPDEAGPEGTVARALLRIGDQEVLVTDSPLAQGFGFTPSFALTVACDDAGQLADLAAALGEGGRTLMPPGDYGIGALFAWVEDRFGVSWHLNVDGSSR